MTPAVYAASLDAEPRFVAGAYFDFRRDTTIACPVPPVNMAVLLLRLIALAFVALHAGTAASARPVHVGEPGARCLVPREPVPHGRLSSTACPDGPRLPITGLITA